MGGLRSQGGLLPGGATPEGKAQLIGGSLPAMKKAGKGKGKKSAKGKKKSAPKKPMAPKGMPPAGMPPAGGGMPFGGGMM